MAVGCHCGRAVAGHGVGRQEVGVAIAAGGDDHSVGAEALELAGDEVLGDDAAGTAVDDHDVVHLVAGVHLHLAHVYLAVERAVGTQQQLLAGLALGIEGAAHLGAAEGAVGQQAAVLAGKGHALCHALVDDVVGHLGQTVHVGLAAAVVAAFHGVVKQAVDRVAVVLIILGCIDTALCSDRVSAARRVLNAEVEHVEAQLAQRCGCRCAGKASAYHDDVEFALVGRVHQALVCFIVGPLLSYRTFGNLGVDYGLSSSCFF